MFHTMDGRKMVENLEEFDDAREVRRPLQSWPCTCAYALHLGQHVLCMPHLDSIQDCSLFCPRSPSGCMCATFACCIDQGSSGIQSMPCHTRNAPANPGHSPYRLNLSICPCSEQAICNGAGCGSALSRV